MYGEIAHIEEAQVDRLPSMNVTEKLRMYEQISLKLTAECKAIAIEAASLRPFVRALSSAQQILHFFPISSRVGHILPVCKSQRARAAHARERSFGIVSRLRQA